MDPNRRVLQPGPAPAERVQWVAGHASPLEFTLEPGLNFIEAIRRPLAEAGGVSAVLTLEGGAFGPFTYVIPAPAPTPEHAAFYSAFHRPPGHQPHRERRRDLRPAGRCRLPALPWRLGRRRRRPAGRSCHPGSDHRRRTDPGAAWMLDGMAFEAMPDPETNFTLFGPVPMLLETLRHPGVSSRRVSGPIRTSAARWKASAATGASHRPSCAAGSPAPSGRCSRMAAPLTASRPRCSSGPAG